MGDERGGSGCKPGLEEIARCRCGRILFKLGELIWGACRACRLLSYNSPTFKLVATTDAQKRAEKARGETAWEPGTPTQRPANDRNRSSVAKKREKRKAHKKRQRRSRAR